MLETDHDRNKVMKWPSRKGIRAIFIVMGLIVILGCVYLFRSSQVIFLIRQGRVLFRNKIKYFQIDQNIEKIRTIVQKSALVGDIGQGKLNLIMVVIDTCRSDALGCCGGSKNTTPNIDRLAQSSLVFPLVIAHIPVTLPSHCTIFTSLYPPSHGIRENGTFVLSDSVSTLAEILKEDGYSTGAVVGSFVLDHRFGLNQGFDYYDDSFHKAPPYPLDEEEPVPEHWQGHDVDTFERTADEITLQGLRWLEQNKKRPFFLWLHYYDPHIPYYPPPDFRGSGARENYLGEVSFVDECLGYLFDYLRRSGLEETTIMVITSDHGEGLDEHGYKNHGSHLYDQELIIPLLVRDPAGQFPPRNYPFQVDSVDIMPTILEMLRIPRPAGLQGKNLLPFIRGVKDYEESCSYAETLMPFLRWDKAELYSVRTPDWKMICSLLPGKAPEYLLFNLSADPEELNNLASRRADIITILDEKLTEFRSLDSEQRFQHMFSPDKKSREKLKSLGYMQ